MTDSRRRGAAGAFRRFLVLLAAPMVLALAASGADTLERPPYGGDLVYVVPTEPASYDGHREGTFAKMHGWAVTPSHFVDNQLDGVGLSE